MILNYVPRPVPGSERGRPRYCFDTFNAEQKMTLTDGTELTAALASGPLLIRRWCASGQCTKVDPAADPAVAGLLELRGHGRPGRAIPAPAG